MFKQAILSLAGVVLGAGLSFVTTAAEAETGASARVPCIGPSHRINRSIDELNFKLGASGRALLQVRPGVFIGKSRPRGINASFVVEVAVNGTVVDEISVDVATRGAITCAVTCAGKCPSIFGDGVCTGCGCRYNNWLTSDLGGHGLAEGDVVSATVIPAADSERETLRADDELAIGFAARAVP